MWSKLDEFLITIYMRINAFIDNMNKYGYLRLLPSCMIRIKILI